MPLTRLVLAAQQFGRDEIDTDTFKMALADFTQQLDDEGLNRLARQLSKLDPVGL
jgi:hypothetical protein